MSHEMLISDREKMIAALKVFLADTSIPEDEKGMARQLLEKLESSEKVYFTQK